ncbi:ribosomal protein L7/L12 [Candidatus Pacearchaeota archaeon]|nr:ribosomal protein L7/L12 [Candidatus Pacearchaeota archaeon]
MLIKSIFFDSFGSNVHEVKKKFEIFDILESIIDRIIPEYQDVPLEYKVLFLKERVANQYIITPQFGFNEDQINELIEILQSENAKILIIKKIRELTNLGLKDTKHFIEDNIDNFDLMHSISISKAKKIIMTKF